MSTQAVEGFTWTGSLDETNIQALYAACMSLRFSGRLRLEDGSTAAEIQFVGGEPIEIEGGDTRVIALWQRGRFVAVQRIPNLQGELTEATEVAGSLAELKASSLWAWVSQYRLSCEIELEAPGYQALVVFQGGHAESAVVNGQPELAALARVSSWTQGSWRVRLRPLFSSGAQTQSAPVLDRAPPAGRQFDLSRSIPLDLKDRVHPSQSAPASAKELYEATVPPPQDPPPSEPAPARAGRQDEPTLHLGNQRKGSGWMLALSLGATLLAGGVTALYYYHLPPFSPPPRPLERVEAERGTVGKGDPGALQAGPNDPGAGSDSPGAGPEAPLPPAPGVAGADPEPPPATAQPGETARAEGSPDRDSPPAAEEDPAAAASAQDGREARRDTAVTKLLAKARLLLIDGHRHSGLETLRKALKLAPKDAQLRLYEQQALGKLGRAELLLEGKREIVIDGKAFSPPKKLRITAGPHDIDLGDGAAELSLKKGERRKLKAHR